MKYVLFEDNIECFPFGLFNNIRDCTIYGGYGNRNLSSKVSELGGNGLVYVDVSTDNERTVDAYKDAVLASKELPNVYVIPIPNIEYIFTYAFLGYLTTETADLLNFEDYRLVRVSDSGKPLSTKRFEYFSKSVVKNYKKYFEDRRFETLDCLCNPHLSKQCTSMSLSIKRSRILMCLPCSAILQGFKSLHDVDYINSEIVKASQKIEDAVDKFTKYGIIVSSNFRYELY